MALRGLAVMDVDVNIRKLCAAALERSAAVNKHTVHEWPVFREEVDTPPCPLFEYLGVRQFSPKI